MSRRSPFTPILWLVIPLALTQVGASCDGIAATPAVTGLTGPIYASAPLGDPRLFIVERSGRIRIANPTTGVINTTAFLDITSRISQAGEGGLLSVAFPPNFAQSGRFYVYFIEANTLDSVLARFTLANPAANVASASSEQVILRVDQPAATNHKGGTVAFSPDDGFLYLALGDGGSDNNTAQNGNTLLGKMLRINVSGSGANYAIPSDNPFVGNDGIRDEIWAFGLRNPFRFGFDRQTGALWVADVGEGSFEEVNYEPAGESGRNYGWPVHEGTRCNNNGAPGGPCENPLSPVRFTFPIHQYSHAAGCSITGGVPYRGSGPQWQGIYFYADFCSERFWSLGLDGTRIELTAQLARSGAVFNGITAITEDGAGEIYVSNLNSGVVHHLDLAP